MHGQFHYLPGPELRTQSPHGIKPGVSTVYLIGVQGGIRGVRTHSTCSHFKLTSVSEWCRDDHFHRTQGAYK